jgi:hypothetical protein
MKMEKFLWLTILSLWSFCALADDLPNPQSGVTDSAPSDPNLTVDAMNQSLSPLLGAPLQYSDRLALSLRGTELLSSPRLGQYQHQSANQGSYGQSKNAEEEYGTILESAEAHGDKKNSSSDTPRLNKNVSEKKVKSFSVYASPW